MGGAAGVALQPLADRLDWHLLQHPVLHADETPVAQLDPGSGKTHRAYLWAYRSTPLGQGPPIIVFDYQTSRSGQHAQVFLDRWQGHLMVDDYIFLPPALAVPAGAFSVGNPIRREICLSLEYAFPNKLRHVDAGFRSHSQHGKIPPVIGLPDTGRGLSERHWRRSQDRGQIQRKGNLSHENRSQIGAEPFRCK